jgi:amicyanin
VLELQNTPPKQMNYSHIIASALIVLAVGAGCGLAGLGIYQLSAGVPIFFPSSSSPSSPSRTNASSAVSVSLPNGVGSTQGLNFAPANVTVAKGGTVTWTNNDPVPHTVTATSWPSGASSFDSGNMNQNAVYTVTFTVDGTYQYKCTYHPWMHGTVIVVG